MTKTTTTTTAAEAAAEAANHAQDYALRVVGRIANAGALIGAPVALYGITGHHLGEGGLIALGVALGVLLAAAAAHWCLDL